MLLIHIFWATLLDYWQTTDRQMGLDWTDIYFDCFDPDMTTYDWDLDATDTTDWLSDLDFMDTCNIASPAGDPCHLLFHQLQLQTTLNHRLPTHWWWVCYIVIRWWYWIQQCVGLVTADQQTSPGSINKFVYYALIHLEHTTPIYLCKTFWTCFC